MDIYKTNNNWRQCDYVKLQAHRKLKDGSWSKESKWKWRSVDQIVDFSKQHNNTLTFCSIGHFKKKDKFSEQLSNLCFDFDCHNSAEFLLAKNSCLRIIDFFGDFGLERKHTRVWFSGGRSYHIEIPHQVFGIEPTVELNKIMKRLAIAVNEILRDSENGLELDLSIYKNPNMFRLPNCYYPKYNAYKIELSWEELSRLDEKELRELARKPRPALHDLGVITFEPIPDAVGWYNKVKELPETKERKTAPVADFKIRGNAQKIFKSCKWLKVLFVRAKRTGNLSHIERLYLGQLLIWVEDGGRDLVHKILRGCDNYNKKKTNYHLNELAKRKFLPVSCKKLQAEELCKFIDCQRKRSYGKGRGNSFDKTARLSHEDVRRIYELSKSKLGFGMFLWELFLYCKQRQTHLSNLCIPAKTMKRWKGGGRSYVLYRDKAIEMGFMSLKDDSVKESHAEGLARIYSIHYEFSNEKLLGKNVDYKKALIQVFSPGEIKKKFKKDTAYRLLKNC